MSKPKQFKGRVYTYSQPYTTYNTFPNSAPFTKQEMQTQQELGRWKTIDSIVDKMDEFPEVERLLAQIVR